MRPGITEVYAKYLRKGDVCAGSGQRVLSKIYNGGTKVMLELETSNGKKRIASWNARTRIGVERI